MAPALVVGVGKASGPGLKITGFYGGPLPPVAGQTFEVGLTVVRTDTGKSITAVPTCTARVRGQALGSTPYILRNQSRCRWQLPPNAGGARLTGSIRVAYAGLSVSPPAFSLDVASSPQVLTVFPSPNYAPSAPTPGVVFYAAVKVRFVGQGGTERNLNPHSSTALCRATVLGAPMKVTKTQVQPGGVICGWQVPANASGKPVVIVVTVRSEGQTASRTFHLHAR
jgi:hypothetical protein